jgi:hypothetical protein
MDLLLLLESPDKVFVTASTYQNIWEQTELRRLLIYHSSECKAYHQSKSRMMEIEFGWLRRQPNFQGRFLLCQLCANPNLDNDYSQGRYASEHANWLEEENENTQREAEELRDIVSDYEEGTKKRS